jgi:glycosyltransferase involved in cell wall biosynthesis
MKIIFSNYDEPNNPYYAGGGALTTHQIAKRLTKKHKVQIVCGAYDGSKDYIQDGVRYKHMGVSWGGPLIGQVVFSLRLPFAVRKEKYDIWVENFLPPHSTNFLQIYTKKPVIGVSSVLHAKQFSKKYRLPFFIIEYFGLKTYKYFIALNAELEASLKERYPSALVRFISRGVDDSYFRIKDKAKKQILFLGRIDIYQKGIDVLLKAWKKIEDKRNYKLIIAGSGIKSETEALQKIINELKVEDTVRFLGRVSGREKYDLISESRFMVLPSRFEGFGNVALEGLASGKAIICSNNAGYSWIPDDQCIKLKKVEEKELAQQMSRLMNDGKLRNKLSKNSRLLAKNFTWNKIVKQFEAFFEEVLEQDKKGNR